MATDTNAGSHPPSAKRRARKSLDLVALPSVGLPPAAPVIPILKGMLRDRVTGSDSGREGQP